MTLVQWDVQPSTGFCCPDANFFFLSSVAKTNEDRGVAATITYRSHLRALGGGCAEQHQTQQRQLLEAVHGD